MDSAFEVLFFTIFAAVVGFVVYRMVRHGGFKAAMSGARIDRCDRDRFLGIVRVEGQADDVG